MKRAKKFFLNAIILTAASLLMRSVGVTFNVYLAGKIGPSGMGLFQLIMSVYSFGVTVSLSGIGLAATRVVTEELARGSQAGAKKAMFKCIGYSLVFGLAAAVLLFFGAPYIGSLVLHDMRIVWPLRVLALGLPFLAMTSATEGYFIAVRRVVKSASANMLEQFIKITLTIYALNLLMPKGIEYACLAIAIGGCVAELGSFAYLYILYRLDRRRYNAPQKTTRFPLRRILHISLPIALSSYARSGLTTIENLLVPRGLRKSGSSGDRSLAEYGMIDGMVLPILMFPSAFLTAFSSLLVPELTESRERGNHVRINEIITRVFQVTLLFAIGVAGVLVSFADELGMAIYHNTDAAAFLQILAPLVIVIYLDGAVDAMLKGLNEQVSSMRYNIIDAAVCVVLVYLLLPVFGIKGYLVVIFVSELLNTFLSVNRLITVTSFKINFTAWILKPILAISCSCASVRLLARVCSGLSASPLLAAVVYIASAILLYLLFLHLLLCVTREDYRFFKAVLK
jgi:stage V sporulation protein B